uniref:Uncharacterized protein n=1 Tax=Caenorhabditis japonica TaxID=281687 RepID=A0A8R1IA44_CAEJA
MNDIQKVENVQIFNPFCGFSPFSNPQNDRFTCETTTTKITKSIHSSSTEDTADHGFQRTRTTGGVPFRARHYLSQFMAREMTEQSS